MKPAILQFAMHYSWSTEARARRALANVSALLRPGGTFIGTMPDANVIVKKLREGFFCLPFLLLLQQNNGLLWFLMAGFPLLDFVKFSLRILNKLEEILKPETSFSV